MTSCWLALCKVGWPQFWGCQHTSILSNPSHQTVLSGGGVEIEERERSSGAIPGHQEVLAQPSWLGYNMRERASWSPKSLKAYDTLLLSSVIYSLCVNAGVQLSNLNGQWEFPAGPSAAVVMKTNKAACSTLPISGMQLYHSWQPMEAKKSAYLLCKSGLAPRLGHSSSF